MFPVQDLGVVLSLYSVPLARLQLKKKFPIQDLGTQDSAILPRLWLVMFHLQDLRILLSIDSVLSTRLRLKYFLHMI